MAGMVIAGFLDRVDRPPHCDSNSDNNCGLCTDTAWDNPQGRPDKFDALIRYRTEKYHVEGSVQDIDIRRTAGSFMLPPFLDSYKEVRNIGFTAIGLSSLF